MKISFTTKAKIATSLLLSAASIIFFYYILYIYAGFWIFIITGVLPILITHFFIRKPDGFLVTEYKHPKLFKIINETAKEVNIKPPSEVVLVPNSMIAVTGLFKKRMLIGIASLNAITIDEFKSIIAHELGHFYGNDTFFGYFIARIRVALSKTLEALNTGNNHYTLFSFLFYIYINIFNIIFSLTTMTYSRQAEYRADKIAANIAGSNIFSEGLLKYSSYSIFFETIAYKMIATLAQRQTPTNNIYETCNKVYQKEDPIKIKQKILEQKTKLFGSHPSMSQRIDNIKDIPKKDSINKKTARTLFSDINEFERKMSGQISIKLACMRNSNLRMIWLPNFHINSIF